MVDPQLFLQRRRMSSGQNPNPVHSSRLDSLKPIVKSAAMECIHREISTLREQTLDIEGSPDIHMETSFNKKTIQTVAE